MAGALLSTGPSTSRDSPGARITLAGMRIIFQTFPEQQPALEFLDAIAAADRLGCYARYGADEIS